ncbi:hypothetical protein BEN47_07705 [Hymenobacter lapidarius]|uniref:AsmA-like C-terminal domain-containing protein n=1 Tax=Hymenobacter lapidarius TaxID=1908237 RepID=A0A1G1TEH2_9BACT|nr:hypothetical protein BEN47_07705 [Hymenobacter lapidarius]
MRWVLGGLGLVLLALVALQFLDPWLRRTLEKQVAKQTQGQYRLQVGELHTSLWQRAVRLQNVRLRPAAQVADTLPRVRLDVARLNVTGIGLLALLRKGVVPIDSVVLDSTRIEVLALASKPTKNAGQPLHKRLPLQLKGIEIGYVGLLHTRASYLPQARTTVQFERADLSAQGLLISAAGAADTQRLAYAADWRLRVLRGQGRASGHALAVAGLHLATAGKLLLVDSLRIRPTDPQTATQPQVSLMLARLRLTGLDAPKLRQRRFQADSLLLQGPQLSATLPGTSTQNSKSGSSFLRQVDLAHVAVRRGYLRLKGSVGEPTVRDIAVSGTALHLDSTLVPGAGSILFARAWDVALGRSNATVAAHAVTLESLHLSTKAGTFSLRSVRIRPPTPGQGPAGTVKVDLTLPQLALTGFDAAALQQRQLFQAQNLLLEGAKLKFTPPAKSPPPVWKMLLTVARRTELAHLGVRNAELRIGGLRHSPEVHGLNLTGRAIRIDSLAALEPRRIAYARAWQASSGLIAAPFDPPYYRASSQRARLDTDAKTFQFEQMALTPKYSAVGMNLHKGYQAPAVTIKLASLAFSGLDFAGLVRRADVRVARVVAQSPVVTIASDGRGSINPNWSKISPEEMIKLPVVVDVRRFDLRNGNLYSKYRSPLTPTPGTLSINRFTGSFYNLSNDRKRQTAATPLTGRATTYLQNRCRLDAQVSMYLLDPRGRHRVWGAFGPGPFAMLNSMTVPTRLVKFKSGQVRRLRFDLQADRKGVTGTMTTEYSGLELSLLSYKQEEIKKTLFSRLKSKVVNAVVIRDQNPRKGGRVVTGEMTSTREPRFSVFTLWRQGIVSGLFHNVGVPQPLAQKLSESKDEAPLPK